MKILYYHCFAGISGDMHLGAMIDLGIEKELLISELEKLNLSGYTLVIEKDLRKGISGTKVTVKTTHHHHHEHDHGHHHEHSHRNLKDIQNIIESSSLSASVKKRSMAMFRLVAEAEAKIHGKTVDEIHFHEVGAIDSIVDTVGAAICIELLKADKIYASTVELGGGFIEIAHGKFPVPAPATAEILSGVPVSLGAVKKEMTTPTGAAILKANVDQFTDQPNFTILKTGYGIGQRDTEIPNVLRVHLGEISEVPQDIVISTPLVTECNIDDMNPEWFHNLSEKLFEAGALDVTYTPIYMKKGRPATKLSVLHEKEIESEVNNIIWKNSTSLGMRTYQVTKRELKREVSVIETPWGFVHVKKAYLNGELLSSKPEYDDCVSIAAKTEKTLPEIYKMIHPYYAE